MISGVTPGIPDKESVLPEAIAPIKAGRDVAGSPDPSAACPISRGRLVVNLEFNTAAKIAINTAEETAREVVITDVDVAMSLCGVAS